MEDKGIEMNESKGIETNIMFLLSLKYFRKKKLIKFDEKER